jgi:TetR/AcrR family transcriptional regulator
MSEVSRPELSWAERAAERSPVVQRSRTRGVEQATAIVHAARRLIVLNGPNFTTQELIKEAGIALQTFYRYFPGKDHLILAVIADLVEEFCDQFAAAAQAIADPVDRLRSYVDGVIGSIDQNEGGPRFITAEHWRLQGLYPEEIALATRPFTDLLLEDIRAGTELGFLHPDDPEYAAWLMTQLVMAVFHHYDGAGLDAPARAVSAKLWSFCLPALGGSLPPSTRS